LKFTQPQVAVRQQIERLLIGRMELVQLIEFVARLSEITLLVQRQAKIQERGLVPWVA